jgi:hypothetical protein
VTQVADMYAQIDVHVPAYVMLAGSKSLNSCEYSYTFVGEWCLQRASRCSC